MTTARPVINDPYDAFRQDSDAWLPGVPGGPPVEFARDIDTFAWVAEALLPLARHRVRPRSLGSGASGRQDTARRAGQERPEPRSWR